MIQLNFITKLQNSIKLVVPNNRKTDLAYDSMLVLFWSLLVSLSTSLKSTVYFLSKCVSKEEAEQWRNKGLKRYHRYYCMLMITSFVYDYEIGCLQLYTVSWKLERAWSRSWSWTSALVRTVPYWLHVAAPVQRQIFLFLLRGTCQCCIVWLMPLAWIRLKQTAIACVSLEHISNTKLVTLYHTTCYRMTLCELTVQ